MLRHSSHSRGVKTHHVDKADTIARSRFYAGAPILCAVDSLVAYRHPEAYLVKKSHSETQKRLIRAGFHPDWWLPVELAERWQSLIYPVSRSQEGVREWVARSLEILDLYAKEDEGSGGKSRWVGSRRRLDNGLILLRHFDASIIPHDISNLELALGNWQARKQTPPTLFDLLDYVQTARVKLDLPKGHAVTPEERAIWVARAYVFARDFGVVQPNECPNVVELSANATRYRLDELISKLKSVLRRTERLAPTPRELPKLKIEGGQLFVNGEPVQLPSSADKRDALLGFLGQLMKSPGEWRTSTEIGRTTKRKGTRFDLLRNSLPPLVRSLIEARKRKGFRLRT